MNINLLLEAGFKLQGLNTGAAITKNLGTANAWLRPKDTIKKIDLMKSGKTNEIADGDLEGYYNALHVLRKTASYKRNQEKKDQAVEMLKSVGVDLTSLSDKDQKLLDTAKTKFYNKYNELNKTAEEKGVENKTETKPVKAEPEQSTDDNEPDNTEEPTKDEPEEKTLRDKSPKEIQDEIEALRKQGAEKIKEIRAKHQTEEGDKQKILVSKSAIRHLDNIGKKFENKMKGNYQKASYGPKNAPNAYFDAKRDYGIDVSQARATLAKGALGRTSDATKENIVKGATAIKKAVEKGSASWKGSENRKKAVNTFDKVKEKIGPKVKTGKEKLSSKIATSKETINKNKAARNTPEAKAYKELNQMKRQQKVSDVKTGIKNVAQGATNAIKKVDIKGMIPKKKKKIGLKKPLPTIKDIPSVKRVG